MIKCERNSKGKTVIEAQGDAMTLAADCCEIISAIYVNLPPHVRQAFKTSVLLAVNHKDSPMWSTERKFDGVAGCVDITELKRQCGMSDEGGSSMTRVDLTKAQCTELANYLFGVLDRGMGAGHVDWIEMLVLARRALAAAEELPEVSVPLIPPPEPVKSAAPSAAPRSGAAEAAELKRATLARLEAYRGRGAGLVSFTPLAELCAPVDGKAVTPEMLGRMLNRERFPVAVWRSVAAALDKMEQKKGVDEDGKDD